MDKCISLSVQDLAELFELQTMLFGAELLTILVIFLLFGFIFKREAKESASVLPDHIISRMDGWYKEKNQEQQQTMKANKLK